MGAIEKHDHAALADLMDENFTTRRRLYGDACLGWKNLQMVEICHRCGAAAKFPGSGGAVLGLARPSKEEGGQHALMDQLRQAFEVESYVFCPLTPVAPKA